jgi:N-acetylglucosaminyldiphosphoundecaprenol N-acetyl-beta-D-mannosaminyltransferase
MTNYIPHSLSILGIPVSIFDSYDDVLQLVRDRVSSRQRTFCTAINPEKVYRAKQDARLSSILHSAHVRLCDGVGISLAAMALHHRRLPRCTGIDLFLKLLGLSADEGWKVYLLGATPQSNAAACRTLVERFANLRIAGNWHGYFEDSTAVVNRINESGADLLFVAMGSPRQEFWISEHMPQLQTTFCMGIGGSLDVVSGTVRRAPWLFQRMGTEWLFRLMLQPSRLRRDGAPLLFGLELLRELLQRPSEPS